MLQGAGLRVEGGVRVNLQGVQGVLRRHRRGALCIQRRLQLAHPAVHLEARISGLGFWAEKFKFRVGVVFES